MRAELLTLYTDLGRYVRCPICHEYSDLTLSWPAAPEDSVPLKLHLPAKAARGCTIFHENSLVAWLWFKQHTAKQPVIGVPFDESFGLPEAPPDVTST